MDPINLADCNIRVGGEAGQGMQTIGSVLGRCFARKGWEVFGSQDVESRIRGGHSFVNVRISADRKRAAAQHVDILVSLDKETTGIHRDKLRESGIILFDPGASEGGTESGNELAIPFEKLASEHGGSKLMINTVASGAVLALMGMELDEFDRIMAEEFGGKGEEIVEGNKKAARAGADFVKERAGRNFKVEGTPKGTGLLFMTGNEAIALGALAAGSRFLSAYPMSPSTSIMEYLSTTSDSTGFVVEQAEDEISAINMAIGASFTGARAMTVTSGGGFSLMVEGLGLAGITETPVVIIECQRPGPATGFPTRTEQADLMFVMHASQGEFPRVIFTPGTPEEAFQCTVDAFNLAERFQTPVIVLSDEHLSTSFATMEPLDLDNVKIDRGELVLDSKTAGENYVRYKVTESGVSPRAIPGVRDVLVRADSDEHTEEGLITETAEDRNAQATKRMRKMDGLAREIIPPVKYGPDEAETVLIGWGSTKGAISEAVNILNGNGSKYRAIHFPQVWPFPGDALKKSLNGSARWIAVEGNATGQLAKLVRMETGLEIPKKLLKFDGRPWISAEIVDRLSREDGE